jgi:quinohemoprotein ethanol dehydrogenase
MLRIHMKCLIVVLIGCLSAVIGTAQQWRVVDDAALRNAAPEEWLTVGHDWAETHYSTLKQIDAGNVKRLGLAWNTELGVTGLLESPPLVSNGILYATGTWSTVFALDARTGKILWQWDPAIVKTGGPAVCCGPVNRGLALYKDKVFAGLLDGKLVALDARTGKVRWAAQTTPVAEDYSITGAPRVYKGRVIVGNAGNEFGVRGYTSAYDAESGKLLWRTYHVPGDPSKPSESKAMEAAGKTWNPKSEWWKIGGGGADWDSYSYDPDADLVYVGTGQGTPWNHEFRGGGDNLYICSVLALRGATGELVWYYQNTPNDAWDYDATQPMILVDLTIGGRLRKVLMQSPKNGFFYVLDRLTGELISAEPITNVTWASGIDKKTGRPIETKTARYGTQPVMISPGPAGAANWHAPSWNPGTGLVYIPGQDTSYSFVKDTKYQYQKGKFNIGAGLKLPDDWSENDPMKREGFLVAWDPIGQKERWRVLIPKTQYNSGTLTTAGNLVFHATVNGLFRAFSADKGEKLWEIQIGSGPAVPTTFELDGKQYISILAGRGGKGVQTCRVWTFVLDGNAAMPTP